jgi:predicted transcriptional regulator
MTKPSIMTFRDFIDEMKSVAAGKRPAPKRAGKRVFASGTAMRQFKERHAMIALESVEAALRLLTGQNHDLIRIIQAGNFNSMAELAAQSGRAESNLNRTIKKLSNLGLVTLKRERGRLVKPELAIRSLKIELDFVDGTATVLDQA